MIYLYLFGTCFHFIYVFMIIGNKKASKVKVGQSYIVRSLSIDGKKVDTSAVSDHYPVFVDVKL